MNTSDSKPKVGVRIWEEFMNSLKERFLTNFAIVGDALPLFQQAAVSYDAGIYLATAILCRATLESAFYSYLTCQWTEHGLLEYNIPTTLNGRVRPVEFAELSNAIRLRIRFSKGQSRAIDRIQNEGNLVAHFSSHKSKLLVRFSQAYLRILNDMSRINLGGRSAKSLAYDIASEKSLKDFKSMISFDKALDDLRDTSSILSTMSESLPKVDPVEALQRFVSTQQKSTNS